MALTTKRIIALPSQTDPQEGDYLAIDNATSGTHKIPVGRIGVEVDDTLTEQGKAADAKAVGDALGEIRSQVEATDDAIDEIRSQIEVTGTASGAVATFTDGAAMPAKSVTVNIEPKQSGSGTPSPENVRQISGWESVNLYDTGKNLIDAPDITLSSAGYAYNGAVNLPATTLTISWDSTINSASFAITDENGTAMVTGSHVLPYTFTLPRPATSMKLYVAGAGTFKNIQVEQGTTATDYEPYTGTTKTVNLGRTVYGGTLDVVSGVLTVDRAMVTLDGTQSSISQGNLTNTKHYSYTVPNMSNSPGAYSADVISDKMPTIADNSDTVHINHRNTEIHVWIPSDKTPSVWFAENPTTVVYPLATPQTYTLTGQEVNTLLGDNNVWADSGDVEVVYVRDLNIAINNLLNNNGTRSLGMMAMSAPTEATAEEPTDEQSDEDMR